MLLSLPRPGSGLQTLPGTGPVVPSVPAGAPDRSIFTGAVARYRALERLREFRQSLYECLDARADALFELADAVLCADHAVTSLVQLCLEPEFTRGHGALCDALAAGRIDDERLFSLLARELPQAVDGPEARAWIAEHDLIDHVMLDEALAGLPAEEAAQVRDACARWSRLRFAAGATACPRPDAWCSPGREHVRNGACRCKGSSKTAPGWEYQFTAAIGHLRTAWAAVTDVARTVPATRTAQTIAQVKTVLRRLRAAGHGVKESPLFVFDAGYSAAALADGLAGCPVHVLVRLAAGSVFYAEPVTWDGRYGRPRCRGALPGARGLRRGHRVRDAGPEAAPAPEPRARRGARPARYPALRHRPGRGLAPRAPLRPQRPRLVRRPGETAGPTRHPRPRHRRAAARRPRPAPRHVAVACRPRAAVRRRALALLPRKIRY
ncbi:MAG TPA: transposase [Trebonia sp.]|nr:transposase [Trebonia sp.]